MLPCRAAMPFHGKLAETDPTAASRTNPTQKSYIPIPELTVLSSALHSIYKNGIRRVRFFFLRDHCVGTIKAPNYSCFFKTTLGGLFKSYYPYDAHLTKIFFLIKLLKIYSKYICHLFLPFMKL